jgi:tRNA(His) 5'-end guanylyltransferase
MKDTLGDRVKSHYEERYRISLPRRTNVIIRVDGKAFHTYTKGLKRPYDEGLSEDMDATMKYLCENIQGAKMSFVQSDEISIWLTDYDDIKTDAWFDYNIQKMCSIAAALATAKFNQLRMQRRCWDGDDLDGILDSDEIATHKLAMFDARVFVIPSIDEVVNYFIWRQQDATRNSISMAAQSMYSPKELHGKTSEEKQEMMFQKGTNWNDYPIRFKRGHACIRVEKSFKRQKGERSPGIELTPSEAWEILETIQHKGIENMDVEVYRRSSWIADERTPIFTQDKHYIARLAPEK